MGDFILSKLTMKITLAVFLFIGLELNVASGTFGRWFGNNCKFEGQTIEHPESGLVLDGSRDEVTLELFKDKPAQRWIVNHTEAGRAYIINEKTNNALSPRSIVLSSEVITEKLSNKLSQQWFIERNGRIRNAAVNYVLDIRGATLAAGGQVILYIENILTNQEFAFD